MTPVSLRDVTNKRHSLNWNNLTATTQIEDEFPPMFHELLSYAIHHLSPFCLMITTLKSRAKRIYKIVKMLSASSHDQ
jgi:hypothetical protein